MLAAIDGGPNSSAKVRGQTQNELAGFPDRDRSHHLGQAGLRVSGYLVIGRRSRIWL